MTDTHRYELNLKWTGDTGSGTSAYRAYSRAHEVTAPGKPPLAGSADPGFRGDADRWNPEELLVSALAQCHMLWYLHLCAAGGVTVTGYTDAPTGTMVTGADGTGEFTEAVLRPRVTVAEAGMADAARALHAEAGRRCFIARSVRFPVRYEPHVAVAGSAAG
ncbi:OsmC family protein [Streptomyces sp. TRM 70351]|uniref:OsmC family protein n=1 Tax=Streptomyces sp. TRM 70351 TaxID=3116552 RepID=UPI002E7BCCB5|nr:OsmC family protein [Streptomyces sp. TRM 70351]MEE1929153.1 OsmC family protein [Streptomyces sp. TRM 70351]